MNQKTLVRRNRSTCMHQGGFWL